ncbi:MAG: DUF4198 domain-containing protein [Planctomycetaceae bacterium]|nr:DUF4198 domain-containing protein [Planctomycetaceae bacterium]
MVFKPTHDWRTTPGASALAPGAVLTLGAALVLELLILGLGAGCSQIPPGVVPVSGQITLDGQPLAGATVTFQPVRSTADDEVAIGGSVGRTDGAGRFDMRLIDPDVPGAAVGKHTVTITTATTTGDDASRPKGERVPAPWRSGAKTFEVPPQGTKAADFALP